MSIYIVALNEPSDQVWAALKENWPARHYVMNNVTAFVAPEGIVPADTICKTIGVSPEGQKRGIVGEIAGSSLQGWTSTGLVDWLQKARNERI